MSTKRETPAQQIARLRRALTTPEALAATAEAQRAFANGLDPEEVEPPALAPNRQER